MDIKFSKDSGDSHQQEAPDDKKNQSALLVLLLVLVGGFSYIYFFTGLIKPQETVKVTVVPAPSAQPQIVKMPLPRREGEPAKLGEKPMQNPEASKIVATTSTVVKSATLPSKPIPSPVPVPIAKPAVAPAKSSAAAKAVAPKVEPEKGAAKPTNKKIETIAGGAKKTVMATVKTKRAVTGPWSLVVGNYVLEEALSADLGRIRKAGFQPVVKASARKKSAMSRLLVNEFPDRASAQPTMDRLKRHTSDAFIIEEGGKFALYAGSYLQSGAANSEKERLRGAGFAVTIKHIDIAIPSQSLSVGPFNNKKAADVALAKLKKSGIKATMLQK